MGGTILDHVDSAGCSAAYESGKDGLTVRAERQQGTCRVCRAREMRVRSTRPPWACSMEDCPMEPRTLCVDWIAMSAPWLKADCTKSIICDVQLR